MLNLSNLFTFKVQIHDSFLAKTFLMKTFYESWNGTQDQVINNVPFLYRSSYRSKLSTIFDFELVLLLC